MVALGKSLAQRLHGCGAILARIVAGSISSTLVAVSLPLLLMSFLLVVFEYYAFAVLLLAVPFVAIVGATHGFFSGVWKFLSEEGSPGMRLDDSRHAPMSVTLLRTFAVGALLGMLLAVSLDYFLGFSEQHEGGLFIMYGIPVFSALGGVLGWLTTGMFLGAKAIFSAMQTQLSRARRKPDSTLRE